MLKELYRKLDQHEKGLGEKVRKIDEDLDYSKYLLPYAREALEILQEIDSVIIFTRDPNYQLRKIASCGLNLWIYICIDKAKDIHNFGKQSDERRIIVIDDDTENLSGMPDHVIKILVGKKDERFESYDNILKVAKALRARRDLNPQPLGIHRY